MDGRGTQVSPSLKYELIVYKYMFFFYHMYKYMLRFVFLSQKFNLICEGLALTHIYVQLIHISTLVFSSVLRL